MHFRLRLCFLIVVHFNLNCKLQLSLLKGTCCILIHEGSWEGDCEDEGCGETKNSKKATYQSFHGSNKCTNGCHGKFLFPILCFICCWNVILLNKLWLLITVLWPQQIVRSPCGSLMFNGSRDSFVNLKTLFHQLLIDIPYKHGASSPLISFFV